MLTIERTLARLLHWQAEWDALIGEAVGAYVFEVTSVTHIACETGQKCVGRVSSGSRDSSGTSKVHCLFLRSRPVLLLNTVAVNGTEVSGIDHHGSHFAGHLESSLQTRPATMASPSILA